MERVVSKPETGNSNAVKRRSSKSGKKLIRPRKPPSAYFLFQEKFSEHYKENHNAKHNTLTLIGKATASAWENLPAYAKQGYEDEAKDLMALYQKNMVAYEKKLYAAELHKTLSPFSVFREEFLKEKAAADVTLLSTKWEYMTAEDKAQAQLNMSEPPAAADNKLLSTMWESLSADEKAQYSCKAKLNLLEYEKCVLNDSESDDSESDDSESDIARAATGFLVFLEQETCGWKPWNKNSENLIADISAKWKSMTQSEKDPYMDEAKQIMGEYEKKALAFFMKQLTDEPEPESEESVQTVPEPLLQEATTGVLIFMDDFEDEYTRFKDPKENPTAFMQALSAAWNNLPQERKDHYLSLAERDMEKYEENAVAYYKNNLEIQAMNDLVDPPEVTEKSVPAATGLLMFLREFRKKDPKKKHVEEEWNLRTDCEKAHYLAMAEEVMKNYEESMRCYFEDLSEYEKNKEAYHRDLAEKFAKESAN